MREHGVVVVFDTLAPVHYEATGKVQSILVQMTDEIFSDSNAVVSWWFPEGPDKEWDHNDNDDMTLVNREYMSQLVDAWDNGDAEGLEAMVNQLRRQLEGWAL